jgi:hypothetical protein
MCRNAPNANDVVNTNNAPIEIISEKIDTIEFVNFWLNFKQNILPENISSVLSDTLIIVHPALSHGNLSKLDKEKFIAEHYIFFSPFLEILQKYDIAKDLGENINNTENEKYRINTYFAVYINSQQIDIKESTEIIFGDENGKTVLGFVKLRNKIKLCYISYFAISVSG